MEGGLEDDSLQAVLLWSDLRWISHILCAWGSLVGDSVEVVLQLDL